MRCEQAVDGDAAELDQVPAIASTPRSRPTTGATSRISVAAPQQHLAVRVVTGRTPPTRWW
ncbi:hypothetical protein JOF29_006028 [Kribbella aluminosa]|uniref:Uncharacterized protein n=1 Tax=Kribbella aluminosa TaxID=416017 RepID=A0ABS4UTG5_9ACTN|nr:hypothetical protein [Kribbella aluminosa]MBP2354918.1 hypothetical protein [Kribbella aluminosa]